MSIYSIYFSPTGGTKKVITALTRPFGKNVQEINILSFENDYSVYQFNAEDLCFVAAPAFGGRVPDIVLERLKMMTANDAKAVPVAVYGNRHYDDTLLELKDTLEEIGFQVIAGVTANAKHSIFKQYATLRPDGEDKAELESFCGKIREKYDAVLTGTLTPEDAAIAVPGNRPYKDYPGHPLKPITSQTGCVLCKSCVKKCPTAAIPWEAPNTTIEDKCITCMRCIAVCPFDARKLDKASVDAAAEKMAAAFEGRKPNELFV